MSLESWLAFCLTELTLCLIPGPAVLFVVSAALGRGARSGMAAAFGILASNSAYFAISATGVAAVLVASSQLFTVLKWAGAAYLIGVGVHMIVSRAAPGDPPRQRTSRTFLQGVVVQGANPKALVFFVALLPQFIDPAGSVALQVLILGVSSVLIELAVLALYVTLAVRTRELAGARLAGPLQRIGGGFLVAAGVRLALVRSHGPA